MYIAYFDETGDDGYPTYSSKIFVLTSVYIHKEKWKSNYKIMKDFRLKLKKDYNLPIKYEIHTKQLLLNKKPYRSLGLNDEKRLRLLIEFASIVASQNLKVINVEINKNKINSSSRDAYKDILSTSLKFNVQRIENDLLKNDKTAKFLIITDEGRVPPMRKIVRKIQVVNPIPSKIEKGKAYQKEISLLIEDPLPKNSKESYFIQIADFISFFVYLYKTPKSEWHNRLGWLDESNVAEMLNILKPILNLSASPREEFGIVSYPK